MDGWSVSSFVVGGGGFRQPADQHVCTEVCAPTAHLRTGTVVPPPAAGTHEEAPLPAHISIPRAPTPSEITHSHLIASTWSWKVAKNPSPHSRSPRTTPFDELNGAGRACYQASIALNTDAAF